MLRLPLFLTLFVATLFTDAISSAADPAELGFVKGHSWGWVGSRGDYASPAAAESMRHLAETGADSVCIAFAPNLVTYDNPHFTWGDENERMVTDDELRHAIDLARENGLKVILKPTVNCDDDTWRAWIRFYRDVTAEERAAGLTGIKDPWDQEAYLEGKTVDQAKWKIFWRNFSDFLAHYAEIAAEKQVDAFCIGCEMSSAEEHVDQWRSAIARVRGAYSGPLTYDINHGRENQLQFWDAVDFISISGYYPVAPPESQSVEEAIQTTTPKEQIIAELEKVRDELREISARHGRPVLFIETGVTNVRGCARYPWTHPGAVPNSVADETEQANYYAAFFEVFWDEPWFMGYTWWDWPAKLYSEEQADKDRGFCIYGKAAEQTLREWYAKPRGPAVVQTAIVKE